MPQVSGPIYAEAQVAEAIIGGPSQPNDPMVVWASDAIIIEAEPN